MATFADLSDQQIHQLAGLLQVNHAGLGRVAVMQALGQNNALIADDNPVSGIPAQTLRDLAHSQGLATYGK